MRAEGAHAAAMDSERPVPTTTMSKSMVDALGYITVSTMVSCAIFSGEQTLVVKQMMVVRERESACDSSLPRIRTLITGSYYNFLLYLLLVSWISPTMLRSASRLLEPTVSYRRSLPTTCIAAAR